MRNDYSHLWDSVELREDFDTLRFNRVKAEKGLQDALRELDFLLKESASTLFGHEREPFHSERVTANAEALDKAHDEIEKCDKALFQFKLKHGENE